MLQFLFLRIKIISFSPKLIDNILLRIMSSLPSYDVSIVLVELIPYTSDTFS